MYKLSHFVVLYSYETQDDNIQTLQEMGDASAGVMESNPVATETVSRVVRWVVHKCSSLHAT